MSKITLEAPFEALHGKICKHSDIIYKKIRQTNFTSRICHPRTTPFSAAELARQARFRSAAAATHTAMANPTTRAAYEAEFSAQDKYQTLYGYIIAQEYKKITN